MLIYNGEPAGQFWVPFAEIRMIAAQTGTPLLSKLGGYQAQKDPVLRVYTQF